MCKKTNKGKSVDEIIADKIEAIEKNKERSRIRYYRMKEENKDSDKSLEKIKVVKNENIDYIPEKKGRPIEIIPNLINETT